MKIVPRASLQARGISVKINKIITCEERSHDEKNTCCRTI